MFYKGKSYNTIITLPWKVWFRKLLFWIISHQCERINKEWFSNKCVLVPIPLFLLTIIDFFSKIGTRINCKGQKWNVRSIRNGAGGKSEEAHKNDASGTQPSLGWEIFFVSRSFNFNVLCFCWVLHTRLNWIFVSLVRKLKISIMGPKTQRRIQVLKSIFYVP